MKKDVAKLMRKGWIYVLHKNVLGLEVQKCFLLNSTSLKSTNLNSFNYQKDIKAIVAFCL